MRAKIKRIEGLALVGTADSNNMVPMDAELEVGGKYAAVKPMELILMGLGGCTAMDVLSILSKKRVNLDDFFMEIEAERAEEHPRVFTKIALKYIFVGEDIPREAVERAIELSETKYCSVHKMLESTVSLRSSYEIREA